MICRRRPPQRARFSSRTYPGSLLWEADPYSPRIFCGERPDKPAVSVVFWRKPEKKNQSTYPIAAEVIPTETPCKGCLTGASTKASRKDVNWGLHEPGNGRNGVCREFLGPFAPYVCAKPETGAIVLHRGLRDHADGSRKCRSRVAAGARRGAMRLLPGCYRVARAQKCSGRVASSRAEVARKVGQPGGRGRRKLLRFFGVFDARREIRACTRPSCILTSSLLQSCDRVFGKSRHKPRNPQRDLDRRNCPRSWYFSRAVSPRILCTVSHLYSTPQYPVFGQ